MLKHISKIKDGFTPQNHGLDEKFLLTKFTGKKGCGCKVPRDILLNLLDTFNTNKIINDSEIDIGLDSCVIPLRHPGLRLVQTTDFFYPLVDDPYLMGRITCANVLSDLYAMGVSECDNMLMLLGVAEDFTESERDIVVRMFIEGFKDTAIEAGTKIRGGQTVRCPWLLLGGVATSVAHESEVLKVDEARVGDVLVLTKPIGGQVAVNAYEWLKKNDERISKFDLSSEDILEAYRQVCEQMGRLNRNSAKLLHKYGARASTDVTGFGLLGHAENLARVQKANIDFEIDTIPLINHVLEIEEKLKAGGRNGFNLLQGRAAETSGGLLIALPSENLKAFLSEIENLDQAPAFLIGKVVPRESGAENQARIIDSPNLLQITSPLKL